MRTRSSDENYSVRLSVCLSVKRVHCDKMEEKNLSRFLYHTKEHLAQFSEKTNGRWGATPSTWNFGSTGPRWSKIPDFEPIFARSASAVTPTEKSSINTNRKSITRFLMNLRWSSYVALKSPFPQKGEGAQKRKTAIFRLKSHFAWKKVYYKVYFCENGQRQSCKAFIGLTICVKIIGGATPSTWNFGSKWSHWTEIADFRSIFARSTSAVTPREKKFN